MIIDYGPPSQLWQIWHILMWTEAKQDPFLDQIS